MTLKNCHVECHCEGADATEKSCVLLSANNSPKNKLKKGVKSDLVSHITLPAAMAD